MRVVNGNHEETLSRRFGPSIEESKAARPLLQRVTNQEISTALRISPEEAVRLTASDVDKLRHHLRSQQELNLGSTPLMFESKESLVVIQDALVPSQSDHGAAEQASRKRVSRLRIKAV